MQVPTILLADDFSSLHEVVAEILAPEFRLVASVSDEEALTQAYDDLSPDVVVTDMTMPRRGGIEAARAIRRRSSDAPIVFLTVHDDSASVHEALKTGALGYVVKADMATDLVPAIRHALEGRCYVSASTGSRLPARDGSGTTT